MFNSGCRRQWFVSEKLQVCPVAGGAGGSFQASSCPIAGGSFSPPGCSRHACEGPQGLPELGRKLYLAFPAIKSLRKNDSQALNALGLHRS